MKKKLLSLLLAVTLIFTALPISTFAATNYQLYMDRPNPTSGKWLDAGDSVTNKMLYGPTQTKVKLFVYVDNNNITGGSTKARLNYDDIFTLDQRYFASTIVLCTLPPVPTSYVSLILYTPVTLSYNANGHGTAPSSKEIPNTCKIDSSNLPKLEEDGYAFLGWYKDQACTQAWTQTYDTVSGDTTLYAKWEKSFTAVTDITGVPTTGTVGTTLPLSGTVEPNTATNQTIKWSIADTDDGSTGATITDGNKLNTTTAGTVTVTAAVANGASETTDFTKNFDITINRKDYSGNRASEPTLQSKTDTQIILDPVTVNGQTVEYGYSEDNDFSTATWQDSTTFGGLTENTEYYFFARVKETNTTNAGGTSGASGISTKKSSANAGEPTLPAVGTGSEKPTSTSITISTIDTQEYLISESSDTPTNWSLTVKETGDSYTFNSLKPKTAYYIHTRIMGTDYAMPSFSKSIGQYTLPTTPNTSTVTINYYDETITYGDTLEVSTTNTDSGTKIANGGKIPETSLGKNIYVRVKAVSGGAPASEWTEIAIPARQTAPADVKLDDVTKTDTTIKIANTVSAQEYSVDGGTTWKNNGSFTVLADTPYNIVTRVKATGKSFASKISAPILVTTLKTTKITEVSNKLSPKYNPDAPIDLTELFTITDGYDGTPTYTVTNVTGVGTVSGNKFTVTKAGEFDVKISAPTTTKYYEASVSTKLIVIKANGTGGAQIDSWTYGDTANEPKPSSTTNSIDNVTYEYSGRNNTEYPNNSIKPTNAGEYFCTAIFAANDLYYGARSMCGFDIDQRVITVTNGDYKVTRIYDGKTDAGTASGAIEFSNVLASDSGVSVKVGTIPAYSNSTVGDYQITVPISIDGDTNKNYRISNGTTALTVSGEIVYLDTPDNPYTLSPTLNSNGWANEDVTITPAAGYTISETLNGTYTNSITLSATQKDVKVYLKNEKGQMTDAITVGDISIDKVEPTGDITFNTNNVKKAINDITFGLFCKDNIDIVITSSDEGGSGVATAEYYRSEDKLTEQEVKEITDWQTYTALSETAVDTEKFIYYVKITDKAGNFTIFGSDGTIFDTTAPSITGVTKDETYYVTQEVVVSDTNLDEEKITLNRDKSTSPIILDGNKTESYTITAVDKALNETTVTVSMKPISAITEDFSELTVDNVKSSDQSKIEAAQEILNQIDLTNATDDEKTLIEEQKKFCADLLTKITDTTEKIKRLEKEVSGYDKKTVTSADKAVIEGIISEIDALIKTSNIIEEEKAALGKLKATVNELLTQIKAAGDASKKALNENPNITDKNVKIADKASLNTEKSHIEKVLKDYNGNLTETEKKTLNTRLAVVNSALALIEKAEKVQKMIDALTDPSKITKNDENAINEAKKAYDALTDYEKSLVDKTKLDKAVEALANAKKSNSPQTGDSNNLLVWFGFMLISGTAAVILSINKKRKRVYFK